MARVFKELLQSEEPTLESVLRIAVLVQEENICNDHGVCSEDEAGWGLGQSEGGSQKEGHQVVERKIGLDIGYDLHSEMKQPLIAIKSWINARLFQA